MSLCWGLGSPVLRGHNPVGRQAFSPGVLFSLVKATKCFLCATPEIKNRFLVIFVQAFKGKRSFFKWESISYSMHRFGREDLIQTHSNSSILLCSAQPVCVSSASSAYEKYLLIIQELWCTLIKSSWLYCFELLHSSLCKNITFYLYLPVCHS